MSTGYERVDQETLRKDNQLNGLFQRIRDDVLKGYVVEIKTRAGSLNQLEGNSKQSSRLSSMSNSMIKQPMMPESANKKDLDDVVITSQRDQQQLIKLTKSLGGLPPKVKSEQVKPIVQDNHLQSEQTYQSNQSFHQHENEDPNSLESISQRLDIIEKDAKTGEITEFIKKLKEIQNLLQLLIKKEDDNPKQQISQSIQYIRTLCLLTRFYKQLGDFKNAIKQLKQIKRKFIILDPNVIGKMQIELGKLYFLNEQYIQAQKQFYEALLHYEKLKWKSEISYILIWMAKLYAWMRNFDQSKKMTFGAIAILKEYLPEDDEKIGEAYIVLGECNFISKNSEQALEFLMKAIQIKFKKYGTYHHIKFVEVYNLLGLIYGLIPDTQQSLHYFMEALQCFQQNCVQRAQILNNIAVIYQSQGIADKAEKCQNKALEIYKTFLPEKHNQMQRLLLNQTCLSPM